MTDTYLALDGPLNGAFITEAQAKDNNYMLSEWSTGETVWLHACSPLTEDDAFPDHEADVALHHIDYGPVAS